MANDHKPLRISWSGLKTWEECHHKTLRLRQGKASAMPVDGRIFLPGTIADRTMRWLLEQEDPQPGMMAAMVPEFFRRYAHPESDEERKEAQYIIRWRGDPTTDQAMVVNFVTDVVNNLEPILFNRVLPHEYVPELKFAAPVGIPYLDGRIVRVDMIGGIDIVVKLLYDDQDLEKGDFLAWDLKATTDDSYANKVLGQVVFYDIGLGHYLGDTDQPKKIGFLTPGAKTKIVNVTITPEDRRAMMSRIIAMAHGFWRKKWDPNPGSHCNRCEVRHACSAFRIDNIVDETGRNRASFDAAARRRRMTVPSAPSV